MQLGVKNAAGPFRAGLLITLLAFQVACVHTQQRQSAQYQAPQVWAADQDEGNVTREAQAHARAEEWFKRRHPRNSLRTKAVLEKQRLLADASTTSGQWTPIGPEPIQGAAVYSGRVWGIAVDPRNNKVIYIGTDGGGVWKTTDGGTTWTPLTDTQANINIRDLTLAPSAPDTIIAAVYNGGLLISHDDGATWTTAQEGTDITSVAISPTDPNVILTADPNCNIARSSDGGVTWTTPIIDQYGCPTQVVFDPTNGSIAYAVTTEYVYRSADGGMTWISVVGSGLPSSVGVYSYASIAIAPSSSSTIYLALKDTSGHNVGFYSSTNSGESWTALYTPPNDDVPYWGWSLRVHPQNPNIVYAGSLRLSTTHDGGQTAWVNNDAGLHVDHHVEAFSADGSTLYDGNDGGIVATASPTASTLSWNSLNATLNTAMFYTGISISPNSLNAGFGGTQDNGILRYTGVPEWNSVACGDGGFTAIDFTNPNNVYVGCAWDPPYSPVWVSSNGGSSFEPATNGLNPNDSAEFIPPLVMDPSDSTRLYFATNVIYQTINGAQSWTPINTQSLYPFSSIAVAPTDSNTVYLGCSDGAVYSTTNALKGTASAWTSTGVASGPVTQVTVDPHNASVVWAGAVYGNGEGPVFLSTDGATTWTQVGHGLPDQPVNDLVVDPDLPNVVYVANDISVYRSINAGQSWLPLGTGLPNVIVNSLRFDRPSRTLRAATYGRGVWDLAVPNPPSIALTPNPILVTDGTGLGITSIKYSADQPANVYVNQTLFCGGSTTGSCETGKWVSNGMTFVLQDAATGVTLATAKARVLSPSFAGKRR
jgi:photosystem II stability/assembly factor-like uncharacterized protein